MKIDHFTIESKTVPCQVPPNPLFKDLEQNARGQKFCMFFFPLSNSMKTYMLSLIASYFICACR